MNNTDNVTAFKLYLDNTLDKCGWDNEIQKGFIFFLGASIITSSLDELFNKFSSDQRVQEELFVLSNLYTTPDAVYNPFNEIETTPIASAFYTYSYIVLHYFYKTENTLDKYIKENKNKKSIVTDGSLIAEWENEFKDKNYILTNTHSLNKHFFRYIGQYLNGLDLDLSQCYIAGVNFYQKYQAVDFDETSFLNVTILNTLSPVFKTLISYPVLYTYYTNELNQNHLFSSILQFLYVNANKEIAKYIHQFHYQLFYNQNSGNIRREWNFEKEKRGILISQIMYNAMDIRKSLMGNYRSFFLNSSPYVMEELKDVTISRNDFKIVVSNIIEDYYKININEAIEVYTHAEFLQLCAILYYETAAHVMLIKEFK